jgi:hypothetical protein
LVLHCCPEHNYWKSAFLSDLSDAALEIMVEALHRCPSPMSGLAIVPYLGVVTRVDATATAFANREPGYSLLIVPQWPDQRETEPNITWAKQTFEALHPYMADRSYVNNLTADDGRWCTTSGAPITNGSSRPSAATTRTTFPAQPQHRPTGLKSRGAVQSAGKVQQAGLRSSHATCRTCINVIAWSVRK